VLADLHVCTFNVIIVSDIVTENAPEPIVRVKYPHSRILAIALKCDVDG
jgi:hypothetical protein